MKVLVIGSGGREHTLIWKIKQSPDVQEIYCSPGNGGIARDAQIVRGDEDLIEFARRVGIDLVVVGPEQPLVDGIADRFQQNGINVFGPKRETAKLEGSKIFAKQMMKECGVPTARYEEFAKYEEACAYIDENRFPTVIKADGLAAGKGVCVASSEREAHSFLKNLMIDKAFGEAGDKVIIEECLEGEEISILALCDGEKFLLLPASQDHKRIYDDDMGPNTGGMGAYCPLVWMTDGLKKEISENVIAPMLRGLASRGTPYRGVLYAGLMMTQSGLQVLEFNVRFGDPETQAVLPLIKDDLFQLMLQCAKGDLKTRDVAVIEGSSVCVVLASGGYPGSYKKNIQIKGLDAFQNKMDVHCFHAGTVLQDGEFYTNGGRVLGITAIGKNLEDAIQYCYENINNVGFDGMSYRKDIGRKGLRKIAS